MWLLLLQKLLFFLVIFSPSSSGSYIFVLFNSLDRNGAVFENVLCDMPLLFN